MHGFNRLGGNSVAETVVAGMIVGEFIADFCDKPENDVNIPTGVVRDFLQHEQAKLDGIVLGKGTEDASAIKARMQEIMTGKVGIFRSGKDLEQAVDELQKLLVRSRNIGLKARAAGRQSRTRHGLSRAEDAEAGAVRLLRRAGPHRKSRRALPRGLPASQRCGMAEAHARDLAGRRDSCRRSRTKRSTSGRWSCRPAGAATARRTTSTIRTPPRGRPKSMASSRRSPTASIGSAR